MSTLGSLGARNARIYKGLTELTELCFVLRKLRYEYIVNSECGELPDGLIARLVEHCTGIAEVMCLNPVQA